MIDTKKGIPMRSFNTEGPVDPQKHYYVPHRLDEAILMRLIEQEKYFVLHAPRQSGKTTAIMIFVTKLNAKGIYKALYINVEPAQALRSDVEKAMKSILEELEGWGKEILGPNDPIIECVENGLQRISGSSFKK